MITRRQILVGLLGGLLAPLRAWAQPLPPSNLRIIDMAIAVDNTGASTSIESGATITLANFAVGSGADRLLIVGVSWHEWVAGTPTVSSITFGGVGLTRLGGLVAGQKASDIWYLKNPANSTANIVVTLSAGGAEYVVVGATSWTGVDQTTTFGTLATANGSSTAPSVNVSSAAGEVVHDNLSVNAAPTITVGADQTQRWNQTTATSQQSGAGSSEAGAATVTMSWTLSVSKAWAIAGVSIKAAAAGAPQRTLLGVGT